jgi:hypothetical protein
MSEPNNYNLRLNPKRELETEILKKINSEDFGEWHITEQEKGNLTASQIEVALNSLKDKDKIQDFAKRIETDGTIFSLD